MLKIMRSHKFFTVFLLSVITIMISIAFIFWGIGPKDNPAVSYVAKIEGERITLDEFWRAYDNEYKRLKDQDKSPEEIEKLNLKERVLYTLVDRTVLLIAAERAGLKVTEKELQEAIMSNPYFQKNGVFDKVVYQRALKLNRITPQTFERGVRNDLLISKIVNLITETAEFSSDEMNMLEAMQGDNRQQLREIFLSAKSNQAIRAYIESIKRQLDIEINREAIS